MENESENRDFSPYLELAESAAVRAGDLLISKMGELEVREKNPGDFVTQADIESQAIIHEMISRIYPDHSFLGEEETGKTSTHSLDSEKCWIVDPLDGTTNYIHGLRSFSISIALRIGNEIVAGCVFDPILKEMYCAELGRGATLNGETIRASEVRTTSRALLAVSLPGQLKRDSIEVQQLLNVLIDTNATVRRLGSAALNLCYVACGRLDGYWSTSAKIWDVAAGKLILSEAGATIRHISGSEFNWKDIQFVATSTHELYEELGGCFDSLLQ